MNGIANLFEQRSMTIDDIEYFCKKNNLRFKLLDDYNMRVTDGENEVAFRVVVDDVVVSIFEAEY